MIEVLEVMMLISLILVLSEMRGRWCYQKCKDAAATATAAATAAAAAAAAAAAFALLLQLLHAACCCCDGRCCYR